MSQLFLDQTEDAELRIAAYLGVMRCPTYNTISLVENVLQHEEVNQGN